MAKSVLITGATRGIGRATAQRFAAAEYDIIAVARTESDLRSMQEEWLGNYPTSGLKVLASDLASDAERTQLGKDLSLLPAADIVVCNAGLFRPGRLLGTTDHLSDMMALNFWAPYDLARHVLPRMVDRSSGHWITVGSVATRDDTAGIGPYAVSKYAVEGLHRSLIHETADKGLHFTLVVPGATYTSSWEGEDFIPDRILSAEQVAEVIFAATRNPEMREVVIRP